MKYVKSISLFFVYPACCFILGFTFGNWRSNEKDGHESIIVESELHEKFSETEPEMKETYEVQKLEENIQGQYVMNPNAIHEISDGENVLEGAGYFITFQDGCVIVYHEDRQTVFLTTDIRAGELPADVQADLEEWMYMENEGMLYDFLENYTS